MSIQKIYAYTCIYIYIYNMSIQKIYIYISSECSCFNIFRTCGTDVSKSDVNWALYDHNYSVVNKYVKSVHGKNNLREINMHK